MLASTGIANAFAEWSCVRVLIFHLNKYIVCSVRFSFEACVRHGCFIDTIGSGRYVKAQRDDDKFSATFYAHHCDRLHGAVRTINAEEDKMNSRGAKLSHCQWGLKDSLPKQPKMSIAKHIRYNR